MKETASVGLVLDFKSLSVIELEFEKCDFHLENMKIELFF